MENLKKYHKLAYVLSILTLCQASVTAEASSFSVEYYLPVASAFIPYYYNSSGQQCIQGSTFSIIGYSGSYSPTFTTKLAVNNAPAGQTCTFPDQISWTFNPYLECIPGTAMNTAKAAVLTSSPSTTPNLLFQTNAGGAQYVALNTSQLCTNSTYNGDNLKFQGCQIDPLTPSWLWCCYSTTSPDECFSAEAARRAPQ